jgi:hypothetical protein
LTLLQSVSLGHIAVTVEALPAVVPVPYHLCGESLVFPAAADPKFARGLDNGVVAFGADGFDPSGRAWSVLVQGICSTAPASADDPTFDDQRAWIGDTGGAVATLAIGRISGWRRAVPSR